MKQPYPIVAITLTVLGTVMAVLGGLATIFGVASALIVGPGFTLFAVFFLIIAGVGAGLVAVGRRGLRHS